MSFHVTFAGSKYTVSGLPSQPLSVLVEQVCQQLKTPLQPETCSLKHGKLTLKLTEPIRFAGLPRGATLVMESRQPSAPRLGFADDGPPASQRSGTSESRAPNGTAPATAAMPSPAVDSAPAATGHAAPAAPSAGESGAEAAMVAADTAPIQGDRPSQSVTHSSSPDVRTVRPPRPETTSTPTASERPAADGERGAQTAQGSELPRETAGASSSHVPAPGFHSDLGTRPAMSQAQLKADALARQYNVFSLAALANEAGGAIVDDPPEEFYDLTAADVQAELLAIRRRQQYNEAGLRTKAKRDQEAAQRAAAIGHATIRLFFPYGIVVQTNFAPMDKLAQLRALVQHVLLTEQFSQQFHLFTTPPKKVLGAKDMEATFWDKGMVPGAHVHVGINHQDFAGVLAVEKPVQDSVYKAFLRSEVIAREGPVPVMPSVGAGKRAASADATGPRLAGDEFRASGSSKVVASGTKVPKWLKLGK